MTAYTPVYNDARDTLGLTNNEFIFLVAINTVCEANGQRWFCAYPNFKITAFRQILARFVARNFTANAVKILMERLEVKGMLELDRTQLRLCVTDKFLTVLNNNRNKINQTKIANLERNAEASKPKSPPVAKETHLPIVSASSISVTKQKRAKQSPELLESFNACAMPTAENVADYREDLVHFVAVSGKADDTLTPEQATFLKGLAEMLNPTEETKTVSEKAMKSLYNKHFSQRVEAIEKYHVFSTWQIDVEMKEKEYLNKLHSTVIWLTIARKYKIVDFTTEDENRLQKAIQFVGTRKNDPNADIAAAVVHFNQKKASLLAQQKEHDVDNKLTENADVLAALKRVTE